MRATRANPREFPVVTTVEAMHCRIPFPQPLQLGVARMTHRDYVLVRVRLSDGGEGHAAGFERGIPLLDLVARVAPHYVGRSAQMRAEARNAAESASPPARAVLMRGISLLDIALWDAQSRAVGLPLWAMLGGHRRRVPVMPVAGYGASPEVVAAQCAQLVDRGFGAVKLMIGGVDAAADRRLMEAVRGAMPNAMFGIDAHWSWRTIEEALPTCLAAQDLGAIFVEDPFVPQQWRSIAQLQQCLAVPLAVGEDVIDRYGFRDVAEAARILRIDASASGGISGALEALHLATANDLAVIPHVFPTLHGHLGAAFVAVRCVEIILPEVGADPVDRLFRDPMQIQQGDLVVSDEPGAAIALDWDRATSFALETRRVGE